MTLPPQSDPPVYRATPPQPAPAYTDSLPDPLDRARHPDDYSRPLYGASFAKAIKRFWKNYARFSGRASRSEFWLAMLMLGVMSIVPGILLIVGVGFFLLGALALSQDLLTIGGVLVTVGGGLNLVIALLTLVPTLALGWRRMHDANLPGPMYLLAITPSWVSFAISTVLFITLPDTTEAMSTWISYSVCLGTTLLVVFGLLGAKPKGRRFDVPR